ncbi:MAG: hypothetical protein DM484_08030 [Candidatus Methylumidiphilus alinenensis]|uniref:Uncharacterized protein n=1 Tax=Candidatus Methylumidiphilus alinenensis TaxID=2202197 RepID=A0A2W4RCN7_9GAMM|nr:MAG: hypothetical protein DM484_08030 [Candidatus Methylumidiphilus alinenensis]
MRPEGQERSARNRGRPGRGADRAGPPPVAWREEGRNKPALAGVPGEKYHLAGTTNGACSQASALVVVYKCWRPVIPAGMTESSVQGLV